MRTVGTVVVEGPAEPARTAELAAEYVDLWLETLAFHIGRGTLNELRDEWQIRRGDRDAADAALERFVLVCRRLLHPDEQWSARARWRRLRRS
ncbi:hypothetical protein ABZ733_20315 [Streptomyces longwoodensis]|uniref:hypothetical protein n=1 Tax=Streptomyces longwoodensis TaxID=68231 RepID=UPI0033C8F380